MSRVAVILRTAADRNLVARWAKQVPEGTRVEFKATKRTVPQSDRMWAALTDVARQAEHNGRRYTADQWKVLFLHACGREVQFIPALDGSTFIPWGRSSSDLSKHEMSELIDFIQSWCAEHGIALSDPEAQAA